LVGRDGTVYGTTLTGGAAGTALSSTRDNNGTLFAISPQGQFASLYSFCSQVQNNVCADGRAPSAALVSDSAGNLYGTVSNGGAIDAGFGFVGGGSGVVFRLAADSSPGGGSTPAVTGTTSGGAMAPWALAGLGLLAGLRLRRRKPV
jgi:hypothetical protein